MIIEKVIAEYLPEPQRLSDFLVGKMQSLSSRKAVRKAIKSNRVLLNGQTGQTGNWVNTGDLIELKEEPITDLPVFKQDIKVIFEDQDLAVVVKPPGIPTSGNFFKTLQNALPHNLSVSDKPDRLGRFQPIHRLDNPTSGLVIIAKTRQALTKLSQALEDGQIHKTYQVIVRGKTPQAGKIFLPVDQQTAATLFTTLKTRTYPSTFSLSLLSIQLLTGRTHQIRKHFKAIGHPVLGDLTYDKPTHATKRMLLRASNLQFKHPISEESLHLEAPVPKWFVLPYELND